MPFAHAARAPARAAVHVARAVECVVCVRANTVLSHHSRASHRPLLKVLGTCNSALSSTQSMSAVPSASVPLAAPNAHLPTVRDTQCARTHTRDTCAQAHTFTAAVQYVDEQQPLRAGGAVNDTAMRNAGTPRLRARQQRACTVCNLWQAHTVRVCTAAAPVTGSTTLESSVRSDGTGETPYRPPLAPASTARHNAAMSAVRPAGVKPLQSGKIPVAPTVAAAVPRIMRSTVSGERALHSARDGLTCDCSGCTRCADACDTQQRPTHCLQHAGTCVEVKTFLVQRTHTDSRAHREILHNVTQSRAAVFADCAACDRGTIGAMWLKAPTLIE
jgi:hypothetical protein